MHSSTSSYIALQTLFKAQHQSEVDEFRILLERVLQGISLPRDAVPDEEVDSFVKGTGSVSILKGGSMRGSKGWNKLLQEATGLSFSFRDLD